MASGPAGNEFGGASDLVDNDRLSSIRVDHVARLVIILKFTHWNN